MTLPIEILEAIRGLRWPSQARCDHRWAARVLHNEPWGQTAYWSCECCGRSPNGAEMADIITGLGS